MPIPVTRAITAQLNLTWTSTQLLKQARFGHMDTADKTPVPLALAEHLLNSGGTPAVLCLPVPHHAGPSLLLPGTR